MRTKRLSPLGIETESTTATLEAITASKNNPQGEDLDGKAEDRDLVLRFVICDKGCLYQNLAWNDLHSVTMTYSLHKFQSYNALIAFWNFVTHGELRSSQELVQTCPCIPESNWNLEMLVFKERGKPQYPEKNLSEQIREPTTNRLNPHTTPCSGFEPGPHWWEASALTTALTLLP